MSGEGSHHTKDFDAWNAIKKRVESKVRTPVQAGEVFWCRLGLNIGVEQDGKEPDYIRPVLILKIFSREMVLIAPLTSRAKKGDWYYRLSHFGETSSIILNQIRPLDTKRLLKSIGQLSRAEVQKILKAYFELISR